MTARVLLAALLAACGSPRPARTPAAAGALLLVRSRVADAALWVDDQPVGDVGRLAAGVELPAGEHRVELRHDRYHTRFAEVVLAPGERKLLELTLTEVLP